jgi:toxin FitB
LTTLLDTNVLRELWHSNGNPKVRAAVEGLSQKSAFLSVISIGEMSKGIESMALGVKRNQIKAWLHQTEMSFAERVLPVISPVAHRNRAASSFLPQTASSPPPRFITAWPS